MSLNIKNPETERRVRELAAATGEGVTEAIDVAVRERLVRLRRQDTQARMQRLREIAADAGTRWGDAVNGDEMLYDELGLPR